MIIVFWPGTGFFTKNDVGWPKPRISGDIRSGIYSLGVLYYELLIGRGDAGTPKRISNGAPKFWVRFRIAHRTPSAFPKIACAAIFCY